MKPRKFEAFFTGTWQNVLRDMQDFLLLTMILADMPTEVKLSVALPEKILAGHGDAMLTIGQVKADLQEWQERMREWLPHAEILPFKEGLSTRYQLKITYVTQ